MWGLAFLTSLFATFGGAFLIDFNILIWTFGIAFGNSIAQVLGLSLKFFAFESAYSNYETKATAPAAYNNILTDFAIQVSIQASAALVLLMYQEDWIYAMWCGLDEEEQEARVETLMAEIALVEAEMGYTSPDSKQETTEEELEVEEETTVEEGGDVPAEGEEAAAENAEEEEGDAAAE